MPVTLENMDPGEIESLALLAKSMRDNPATRRDFLRNVKKANPALSIPEIDMEDARNTEFAARDKELAELKAKLDAQEQQTAAQARIAALREKGVVRNSAHFSDVVKYAAENGFQTSDNGLERAAAAMEAERQAAIPTPTNVMARPAIGNKDLMKNPQNWARHEAAKAMDEIIKARKAY